MPPLLTVLKWSVLIISIFASLLLIVSYLPSRFEINYYKQGLDDRIEVWWHIVKWKVPILAVPVIKLKKDVIELKTQSKTIKLITRLRGQKFRANRKINWLALLKKIPEIKSLLTKLSEDVQVKYLRWKSKIGMGDARQTAMAVGALWGIKFALLARTGAKLEVNVLPDYRDFRFDVDFHCILRIRPGHIMLATMRVVWLIIKMLVKGDGHGGKTPNRRTYENRYALH